MNIALRKRRISPVRLVLEDYQGAAHAICCCFFAIGVYNLIQSNSGYHFNHNFVVASLLYVFLPNGRCYNF